MRITTVTDEGVAFLTVVGDVDVETADELRRTAELALTPPRQVRRVLEITGLTGVLTIDLAGV